MSNNYSRMAVVRFSVVGFHRWPGAAGKRSYLADRHRHMFFVEASVEVFHNEREIEFHDFQDFCKDHFPSGELGDKSCETLAMNLVSRIESRWPERKIKVGVFEDNEVGAYVQNY